MDKKEFEDLKEVCAMEINKAPFRIYKGTDDPICPRISMGGTSEQGFYFVYRGNLTNIHGIVALAKAALDKWKEDQAESYIKA